MAFFLNPLIYLISLLPFPVLYLFSDFLFIILFRILKYRKNVVFTNLSKAFPSLNKTQINSIAADYYHFLCDLLVESIKGITISKNQLNKRFKLSANAIKTFNKFYEEKKSIAMISGHYGNWEWAALAVSNASPYKLNIIYHPLSSKYFDRLMLKMRSRFGAQLVPMDKILRKLHSDNGLLSATVFLADQTPPPEGAYWTSFLNQDTPVFTGTEKITRKFDMPVVYIFIKRIKRGYYELFTEVITANPKEHPENFITEKHTRLLENQIISVPEFWLWSHRRWKHRRVR